jgi:transposase
MVKQKRRAYADDYKQRAVDLVVSSSRSAGSVARELGLHESVLCRWMAERGSARAQADGSVAAPPAQATLTSADQAAEIARLQRENERLRLERDILKKSIAIFAGDRT